MIRLGHNAGYLAPWQAGLIARYAPGQRYVVTDPDVVPDENCPTNLLSVLSRALTRFPDAVKEGIGLRTDDLPWHYPQRDRVIAWEKRFSNRRLSVRYYRASVDTTFALYRNDTEFSRWPSIRTADLIGRDI